MIETLRIASLAIVEEVELELGAGLNVLTGETGAGKSIILGSLSLLTGGRASASAVRAGADQALVEAVLRADRLPGLRAELEARGLDAGTERAEAASEGDELILHRTVSKAGRGRTRIGGQLVPVSTLADILAGRVEISSQLGSQALLRTETHGELLDRASGLGALRARVAEHHGRLREIERERTALRARVEERERQRDYLAFQLGEIDEVGLEPGELDALGAEHGRLAHGERLREEGFAAIAALDRDPTGGGDDDGAADRIDAAAGRIGDLVRFDPALEGVAARLQSLAAEAREVARDLEHYVDGIEVDPGRLAALEERLRDVERLRRKYGRSEDDILSERERLASELAQLEGADARIAALDSERADVAKALTSAGAELSAGRAKGARRLARKVLEVLDTLAMPDARFEVALEPAAPEGLSEGMSVGPTGAERPVFRFSGNRGEPLAPLQKVVSGGELSRVFLAVKSVLGRASAGSVLVFDEVDAGIGGAVAERVGRALAELARHHQVLCITHLPQIAALADVHFRVEKGAAGRRTVARVSRVEGELRVDEIARMAGGESVTAATRRHARELLDRARP